MDDDRTPAGLPPVPLGPDLEERDDTPTDPYRPLRRCECATRRDLVIAVIVILLALAWLHG